MPKYSNTKKFWHYVIFSYLYKYQNFENILIIVPHIVFDEKIELLDFSKKFIPIFEKEQYLIKISDIFVNKEDHTALLPAVAISHIHQQYLIEISTRKYKTTIRLYPGTDPEKTDAVKLSLALLAGQIIKNYPNFQIIKTNLNDYINMVIAV